MSPEPCACIRNGPIPINGAAAPSPRNASERGEGAASRCTVEGDVNGQIANSSMPPVAAAFAGVRFLFRFKPLPLFALWPAAVSIFASGGVALAQPAAPIASAAANRAPNIVLVMTDDQGYGDLENNRRYT